ncbi:hypothetical protein DFH09DRAFT_1178647 [Mycena vulgaris]|nr:hypothetical protein DFH09DRAFT_1178647 [Mycena vulgaris]
MPPRTQPKVFQILVKTHKLTILTTVAPTITVGALKAEVLSALSSDVNQGADVPAISSARDFELCKGEKERGKLTGTYTPLDDPKLPLKDAGVGELGAAVRDLLPVVFVPFEDDEDEVSQQFSTPAPPPVEASTSRGKRKARPD